MGFFNQTPLAPADPIFGIEALFRADSRPEKLNLAIGIYRQSGKTYLFEAVRRAQEQLVAAAQPRDYLTMEGDPRFLAQVAQLALPGQEAVSLVQTVGGTGALRLAGDFLLQSGLKNIFLPQPTWSNHHQIFARAGLHLMTYPYYDMKGHQLMWQELVDALEKADGGAVLFHACCHNPTGADPSQEQWQQLAQICRRRGLFPLFDLAYPGFGAGLEADFKVFEVFQQAGLEFAVALSFSKSMGLYGDRLGALLFCLHSADTAVKVGSQLRGLIRTNYSNPPRQGSDTARTILESPELGQLWRTELERIRLHLIELRRLLAQALGPQFDWLMQQRGMFSSMGLSAEQVELMRSRNAIYMGPLGRINMAGLTAEQVPRVALELSQYAS